MGAVLHARASGSGLMITLGGKHNGAVLRLSGDDGALEGVVLAILPHDRTVAAKRGMTVPYTRRELRTFLTEPGHDRLL